MNFCTAADSNHYFVLLNLIGSIYRHDADSFREIAVFDLGMTPEQLDTIRKIDRVKVFEVEKVHPLITTFLHSDNSRWVRGLFSWKPVVIKQALEMYDEVLYLDSGTTIMNSMKGYFSQLRQDGYVFFDCGHSIKWMTPKYIIEKMNLNSPENQWILNDSTLGIDAGFQAVSRRLRDNYVMPMYELAKEIRNFIDDGTCPEGWGTARHDQTLFSIYAQKLGYKILLHDRDNVECVMSYDGKTEPFHLTHAASRVKPETNVFRSRRSISQETFNDNVKFIRMK
jgi:hypothetical protein